MKLLKLLFVLLTFCCLQSSFSQTCPPNIDFESGDFTNWDCFTGTTRVVSGQNNITLTPSGPVAGRHEIISASSLPTNDPYGGFPRLCPYGGNYSVKLGNNSTGSQAEGLSYTFVVPSSIDTFTFTYFYAVVLENPSHSSYEQPRFFVTAYDVVTGNLINCASFDYISTGGLPGFAQAPNNTTVLYKDWSPASLQFAGLGGHTVRLEFKTADCTLGGHFGYAYLDVGSACSNIMATAPYCVETNSLILNAPYGFQYYTWYNSTMTNVIGTQRSLTLSPPPATSGTFYVDVRPYPGYGCRDTLQANVVPLPVPDTPVAQSVYDYCQFQTGRRLTATALPGNDLLWYSADTGGIGSSTAPIPATGTVGTLYYYVTQKILFGCESFRKKITINVYPTPVVNFTVNQTRQCLTNNAFVFTNTSTNQSSATFNWNLGGGQTSTDTSTTKNFAAVGNYSVSLQVTNGGLCTASKTATVTVLPQPIAAFTYPPVICQNQTPIIFTNTSYVPGNAATISNWWWNANGTILQTQAPTTYIPTIAGALPVQLVVKTVEGCISDTSNAFINIRYQPTAALKLSTLLCDNELLKFTDASYLPQTAPADESITKWYWEFDSPMNTSAMQNPVTVLPAGSRQARLKAETNFGCQSIEKDSVFIVNAKPQIAISINDSCVFRPIRYAASDVLNTVNKWYWDFGKGLKQNSASVTQTYTSSGDRPFTVVAFSIYGCKDTITRPFTIYDNTAFAGRDTIVAWDEPLQLNAHGHPNTSYTWTPAIGLNDAHIGNPVATLVKDQLYQMDAMTDKGCDAHSKIMVKRFKGPELYIPSAFTPNGDGKNDLLKVFPVGISKFGQLSVYNRQGQRLFYTTDFSKGWDGKINGDPAPSAAYVAYATATDYRGRLMENKLTVVLIR